MTAAAHRLGKQQQQQQQHITIFSYFMATSLHYLQNNLSCALLMLLCIIYCLNISCVLLKCIYITYSCIKRKKKGKTTTVSYFRICRSILKRNYEKIKKKKKIQHDQCHNKCYCCIVCLIALKSPILFAATFCL